MGAEHLAPWPDTEGRKLTTWRAVGALSAALLPDEIAESGLVPSGDFAHEVPGQFCVAGGAGP